MADIKVLVASRGRCKGAITRLKNSYSEESYTKMPVEKIKVKRQHLKEVYADYNSLCAQILAVDPQDNDDQADVEETYLDLLANFDLVLNSLQGGNAACSTSRIKLPNVVIPTFTEVKQHLAALKNLGEPIWDSIIVCIVLRKLDMLTSRAFKMERDNKSLPTVVELTEFLERRALALETNDNIPVQNTRPQRLVSHAVATPSASAACSYCPPAAP
ncbi:uncharacterized protein LOC126373951 isoform X3 [Pectinophora gossypiella]|uniref:uncharacterized protein LOC126373281 isoform X3 n=1 Tax=Pectinophora gossypiella TaxID=13191 RepID=UPI00214EEDD6|nr:uncharacterized protein LOC126373281 isoform X3 [Pectinophora gossypiella]XP_049876297.1 uncharacterized protein LOC126373951 isoform X3 [Pectinophora gossypiella]